MLQPLDVRDSVLRAPGLAARSLCSSLSLSVSLWLSRSLSLSLVQVICPLLKKSASACWVLSTQNSACACWILSLSLSLSPTVALAQGTYFFSPCLSGANLTCFFSTKLAHTAPEDHVRASTKTCQHVGDLRPFCKNAKTILS